jgi:three-Cys-motif partner protein
MGRSTSNQGSLNQFSLWSDVEAPHHTAIPDKDFASLRDPLWTRNKALLIQEYLRLFILITKHGLYIDGFAAPQKAGHYDKWSAKLVLETEPKWMREFWLCDVSTEGVEQLRKLVQQHPDRRIEVLVGDFNETVKTILESGKVTEKKATFALLDQRTFECNWETVQALAKHKKGKKIELFYFLASGWLDRSLKAVERPEARLQVKRWWGRDDVEGLGGMDRNTRALMMADRFMKELGYLTSTPYAIHSKKRGGRIMYHMIHASDHEEAKSLMVRAYRKISGRSESILIQETML